MQRTAERPVGFGVALRLRIELWVAIVFMALAFGAGIVVRELAQPPPETATQVMPGTVVAPPLSPDEIQQGLPPGHPPLDDERQGKDKGKPTG